MNKTNIECRFGFDESVNRDRGEDCLHIMSLQINQLQKRVKKTHPLATFRQTAGGKLAIRLSPNSLCFDAIVDWCTDAYVVMTVSTARGRDIAYHDKEKYGVSYSDQKFTSITKTLARATKLIKDARSVTPERVLAGVVQNTVSPFNTGLSNAQGKLETLERRVFSSITQDARNYSLLEYCLATREQRPVRATIQREVEECTDRYLEGKKDLGDSITACQGLQVLSIYKVKGIDKVFYHYRDMPAAEMYQSKYVNNVNDLPQEVLTKLSVLQTTGVESMENIGYSYDTKVLTSIGSVTSSMGELGFVEDAMCVYVSPETMVEVEALDKN
jgi:hypothetical protein